MKDTKPNCSGIAQKFKIDGSGTKPRELIVSWARELHISVRRLRGHMCAQNHGNSIQLLIADLG